MKLDKCRKNIDKYEKLTKKVDNKALVRKLKKAKKKDNRS